MQRSKQEEEHDWCVGFRSSANVGFQKPYLISVTQTVISRCSTIPGDVEACTVDEADENDLNRRRTPKSYQSTDDVQQDDSDPQTSQKRKITLNERVAFEVPAHTTDNHLGIAKTPSNLPQ